MALVVLMCGPAAAGKSTIARALAGEGLLRLSVDEVAWNLGYRNHPIAPDHLAVVHAQIRERLVRASAAGRGVVVDTVFCTRAARDDYRALLAPLDLVPVVCYVATPREEILRRVLLRDNSGPDRIAVTVERAGAWFDGFDVPTPGEGPLVVVDGTQRLQAPALLDRLARAAGAVRVG